MELPSHRKAHRNETRRLKQEYPVEYILDLPPAPEKINLIYDYAVVLEEPDTTNPHLYCERPRFSVEIKDDLTNQTIPCGYVEYIADSSSVLSGGFIRSSIPPRNQIGRAHV